MNWFFYVKALFDPRYELILPAFIYLIGLFFFFFFVTVLQYIQYNLVR